MVSTQITPDHSPSADVASDLNHQVATAQMRGMDSYQLLGQHPTRMAKPHRLRSYFVSESREASFLFQSPVRPALKDHPTPDPTSDTAALDAKVQERFSYPLWQRGYLIKGRISINGRRKHLYVNGRLFRQATRENPIPRHNAYQYGLAWYRSRFGPRIVLDQALWLSHPYAKVYFHTFNDVMTQLALANTLGISKDIPVIVDHDWIHLPHAQHFLASDLLKGRKIVVLKPGDTLVCRSLYMLQPQLFCRPLLDRIIASFPEEKPLQTYGDRLVLIRDKATTLSRCCDGMSDLIAALEARGFSTLDPATLTIPQQKWVFSRAKHIVAENGSSLTNIVFRGDRPLRIDALMASTFPSITFQCLSKVYGFRYHAHVLPSTRTGEHFHSKLTAKVMDRILIEVDDKQKELT
jgi:hypothetical protein